MGAVVNVEPSGRVAIVKQDDAGKGTGVATEMRKEALNAKRVCRQRCFLRMKWRCSENLRYTAMV
jgi:hypothetical protein